MIRIALQKPYNVVGLEENYFMRNNLESCFLKNIYHIYLKYVSFLWEARNGHCTPKNFPGSMSRREVSAISKSFRTALLSSVYLLELCL